MRPDAQSVITSAEYYNQRHARGWMDSWPEAKQRRVVDLVREAAGERPAKVLEYGCGVGVFANAVKTAMPHWEVHGCDISPTAIARARERCPGVQFHVLTKEGAQPPLAAYDVIYSHHVLEHVEDVGDTLARIARALKVGGKALHIAPCANPGSLEYRISRLRQNGAGLNGCFAHDDSSHVRRLTSAELREACRRQGLCETKTLFANQFWGGIDYLTGEYHWTLLQWLNPFQGVTSLAKLKLSGLTIGMMGACLLRQGPRHVFSALRMPSGIAKKWVLSLAAVLAVPLYPVSIVVDRWNRWMSEREWKSNRRSPEGSEMYALFEKL